MESLFRRLSRGSSIEKIDAYESAVERSEVSKSMGTPPDLSNRAKRRRRRTTGSTRHGDSCDARLQADRKRDEEVAALKAELAATKAQLAKVTKSTEVSLDELEAALRSAVEAMCCSSEYSASSEAEVERLSLAIEQHPERLRRDAEAHASWVAAEVEGPAAVALREMKHLVPVDVSSLSQAQLSARLGSVPLAKRFIKHRALWIVRANPNDLSRLHPSDLEGKYVVHGLDIVETRAIWMVARLAKFEKNDGNGRKQKWFDAVERRLKELVNKESKNVLAPKECRHDAYFTLGNDENVVPSPTELTYNCCNVPLVPDEGNDSGDTEQAMIPQQNDLGPDSPTVVKERLGILDADKLRNISHLEMESVSSAATKKLENVKRRQHRGGSFRRHSVIHKPIIPTSSEIGQADPEKLPASTSRQQLPAIEEPKESASKASEYTTAKLGRPKVASFDRQIPAVNKIEGNSPTIDEKDEPVNLLAGSSRTKASVTPKGHFRSRESHPSEMTVEVDEGTASHTPISELVPLNHKEQRETTGSTTLQALSIVLVDPRMNDVDCQTQRADAFEAQQPQLSKTQKVIVELDHGKLETNIRKEAKCESSNAISPASMDCERRGSPRSTTRRRTKSSSSSVSLPSSAEIAKEESNSNPKRQSYTLHANVSAAKKVDDWWIHKVRQDQSERAIDRVASAAHAMRAVKQKAAASSDAPYGLSMFLRENDLVKWDKPLAAYLYATVEDIKLITDQDIDHIALHEPKLNKIDALRFKLVRSRLRDSGCIAP